MANVNNSTFSTLVREARKESPTGIGNRSQSGSLMTPDRRPRKQQLHIVDVARKNRRTAGLLG